ncbi:MAG: hypothetical protein R6V40_03330 [Candidatus Moraniibacteriota bacterium]
MSRNKKRILISVAYLFVFVVLVVGLYTLLSPRPTCNDGIRNQLEEGIDCGGPCKPCPENRTIKEIEVIDQEWANITGNKFDVAIEVKNKNSSLGAESFEYRAEFLSEGEVIKTSDWHQSFILPEDDKYVLIQNVSLPKGPDEINVKIKDIQWQEFSDYATPKLPVVGNRFEGSSEDNYDLSRVVGTVLNESNVDFENIKVKALLRSESDELVAVNSQVINTVRAGERRDFKMVFSSDYYLSKVSDLDIETETNVFNSENYIKTYGEPQDIRDR